MIGRRAGALAAIAGVLIAAAGAPALFGDVAEEVATAEPSGPRITMAEAVAATLRNSYNLQQLEATVEERRGAAQAAAGPFDRVLFAKSDFMMVQQALLRDGLDPELRRRVPIEFVAGGTFFGVPQLGFLDAAADDISSGLATAGSLLFDDCRLDQTRLVVNFDDGTAEGSTITLCLNSDGALVGLALGDRDVSSLVPGVDPGILPSDLGAGSSFGRIRAGDLDELINLLTLIDLLSGDLLDGVDEDLDEAINDLLRTISAQLRTVAVILRLQRNRLGDLPEEEQLLDLRLQAGARKRYRNGVSVNSAIALIGRERNYADKPLDASFGGAPDPNSFTTSVGVRVQVPLAKGRGRVATAGPEQASLASLRAQQRLYVHEASKEALATIEAYWGLAAALERLRLLDDSASTQREILDNTRQLVEADELPGADLARIEARNSEVLGQVAAARQAVIEARLGLVRAMGQTASTLATTPLAADPLPSDGGLGGDAGAWAARAFLNRDDLAAAAEARQASDILAKTARTQLRRQIDLDMSLSFNAFHESFDQRIYDPSGYWDAVQGRGLPLKPNEEPFPQVGFAGPSYTLGLRWNVPVKNSEARGRLLQAQAAQSRSRITETDLKRQINVRLQTLVASLERRHQELEGLRATLASLEETFRSSFELYRAGDITLIDTLTTEQQLTGNRLGLVDVQREIAILESQILFEAGQLLDKPEKLEDFEPARLKLARRGGLSVTGEGP